MKIDFEHLGGIDKGSIELNDFTIFCGKNNSGKTYVMYSLYGLLNNDFNINICFDFVTPIWHELKEKGIFQLDISDVINDHWDEMISVIKKHFKDALPSLFGVKDDVFLNTIINITFDSAKSLEQAKNTLFTYSIGSSGFISKELDSESIQMNLYDTNSAENIPESFMQFYISRILCVLLFEDLYKKPFLLPAEREGINLFFKELFSIRNSLLQKSQDDAVDPINLLRDVLKSRYAEPVKDYLQYLNNIGTAQKAKSDYSQYAQILQNNVLGGKYEVDDFGNVFFITIDDKNKLPLHFSSSTVKALFGLVFYLEHLAKSDDYLMIDEPELNLHPDNQREVARILAQLVNAGIKVVVSTHSNYFMREINNLIMLKNEFSGVEELRQKYQYNENELLDKHRVSAYLFDKKSIFPMPIDEEGIVVETFDTVTDALNQSSDDIYFTMQDAKEADN
jgi:energy-coupling factor transporter ATP-binding protein EcfA2